jgi:hypothetical protein
MSDDDSATVPKVEPKAKKNAKKRKDVHKETKDEAKDDKVPKKPRCTPELAQAVADKIKKELVDNYTMGIEQVQMDILAPAVGYKHPRSDAMAAAVKLLKAQDTAFKSTQDGAQYCGLTAKGVAELVPQEESAMDNAAALKKFWSHAKAKLAASPKTASGKAHDSALAIWNALKTGGTYTKQELLGMTHYGMERSTGFPEILNVFLDLSLMEKTEGTRSSSTYRMTDKVFPFGRPE